MNYTIDTLLSDLKKEFESVSFSFEEISYQGNLPCFFIEIEEENQLAEIWMKISDVIAINHQSRLKNEFSIWNIYLFFLMKYPIENDLKYLIENDTFSSRKIVVDKWVDSKDVIEKYIRNSDIIIDNKEKSEKEFIPNLNFFNQVDNIEAKSRVTNAIKEAYSQIVRKIKEDRYEI